MTDDDKEHTKTALKKKKNLSELVAKDSSHLSAFFFISYLIFILLRNVPTQEPQTGRERENKMLARDCHRGRGKMPAFYQADGGNPR